MIGMLDGGALERPTCSRAGCTAEALWHVAWRNPRIHDETRRKVWLACDAHRDYLEGFLASRAFPVEVSPLTTEMSS